MAKLNNDSFKFYIGQTVEVTDTFIEGNTEYPHGKILVIENIIRDCFVAGDGHKVSKIWISSGVYFTSDFLMEHTKPRRLRVFNAAIEKLTKLRNVTQKNLQQITEESDKLSSFFGGIMTDALIEERTKKCDDLEAKIRHFDEGIAYYGTFDLAVQRFLIYCEEKAVPYEISSFDDKLNIHLKFNGFKTIAVSDNGISYGDRGCCTDLFTTNVPKAYESKALCTYDPIDPMACAIQKLFRQFLSEAGFCFTADDGDEYI